MIKKAISSMACVGVAAALAISTVATPASAAAVTTTVQIVQYYQSSLLLQLNGGYYYAQLAPGGTCSGNAKNIDTLKAWQNLATAALLSGKQVYVQYTACTSGGVTYNYIDLINLNQ